MDETFIILDYRAMKDEEDAKEELKEIERKEKEVKREEKKNNRKCYL